jgi:hypothetical protein
MRPSEHLLDFGRPVAFYPGLVKHFGSVNAVLFFCQIFYWRDRASSELGVYKSVEDIEAETGLTYREQVTARKLLVERGVLIETPKRLEHRIYFRIDEDRLDALLANCETRNSRTAESAFREERNPQSDNRTEITTETTAERHKRARVAEGSPEFEQAWSLYPKRAGGNSKADALKAWNARIAAGIESARMLDGVQRYAAFCKATNKIGTEYVKQAATFFGPGLHFDADWTPPIGDPPRGGGRPSMNSFDQSQPDDYDDFFDHRRGFDQ